MASFADKVKVLIDVDSTGATSGLTNFKKSFQEAEGAVGKFKVAGGAAMDFIKENAASMALAAGAAMAAFGAKAIGAAADYEEALSKTKQIFGSAGRDITDFAETASRELGQSKQDVLDAAGTFGIFGKAAGLAGDDLSKFTIDLTTLASDLASFNNTKPEEAIEAIGAALRGESEPIRKFGVMLNDAALKAEAFRMGIYKGIGPLNDQQKILAVNEVLFRQTRDAQGDFMRTSDGLANQTKILSAELENVAIDMGQKLLPAAIEFMQFANTYLLPVLTGLSDSTTFWGRAFNLISGFITKDAQKIHAAFTGDDGLEGAVNRATAAFWDGQEAMNRARYQGLKLTEQLDSMDKGVNQLISSWDEFLGRLDSEEAWINLQDQVTEYDKAISEAFKVNTPEAWRTADDARREAQRGVAEYIKQIGTVPANVQTQILALVEEGAFAEAMRRLDVLARTRTVGFRPILPGDTPSETTARGSRALGGPVSANVPYLVGERGPEMFIPSGSGRISPGMGGTVVVNVAGSVVTENQLVESIRKGLIDAQRNGKQLVFTGP